VKEFVIADTCMARTPSGINIAAGSAVVTATAALAAAVSPNVPTRLLVMALAVAVYTVVVADTCASGAVAALAYLLFDGFLVNRHGELTWDGTTSTWYLTAFVVAAGPGLARRWVRYARVRAALVAELDELVNTPASNNIEHKESRGA
jgi:hypothetical protein